jgi:tetratricopeptide (TPR) repeat protein
MPARDSKISWRVLPIALLLFVMLCVGFDSGQKAVAYQAYIQRDYAKALEIYRQINDESGCGLVFLAMNQPDQAIECFSRGNDKSGLGLAYCKKRQFAEALNCFDAVGDDSGKGLAYLGLRDEGKARECFTRANDWSGLGLLALAKKDYAEAERCFGRVNDYSGLGLTALQQKKFDDAERFFRQAHDLGGDGLLWLAKRNHRKAVEVFQSAHDLSGEGYVHLATGNPRKARQCFLAVNDWNGLGDLYSQLNQFAKAREMFEKDHNPVKVIQSYRNDYSLPDRFQRAIAYGQTAVTEGRMAPECLMEMADVYYELGQIEPALASLDRASTCPGYASQANLMKGRILFFQRDFEGAKAAFARVAEHDLSGGEKYADAQKSLADIERYRGLKVRAAQGY